MLVEGDGNIVLSNTISGNMMAGVSLTGDANAVRGNLIGTTASGTTALANVGGVFEGAAGVTVAGTGNFVGGTTAIFADFELPEKFGYAHQAWIEEKTKELGIGLTGGVVGAILLVTLLRATPRLEQGLQAVAILIGASFGVTETLVALAIGQVAATAIAGAAGTLALRRFPRDEPRPLGALYEELHRVVAKGLF